MADAGYTEEFANTGVAPHPRSCVVCRQRKVKCDRQQPCSNCTRSKCACVYPTGRGRAPKRARRVADAQLADKLARLETIIQRMAQEHGPGLVKDIPQGRSKDGSSQGNPTPEPGLPPESSTQEDLSGLATSTSSHSSPTQSSIEASMSRLVIDDKKSYYVSNPLWSSMAQEIEELRDFLDKSEDEDDEEKVSPDFPCQQSNTNAALFGYRAIAHSLQSYHPPLQQAVNLFAAFNENVVPLLRIFHVPSLSTMYWEAIGSPASPDKNVEALVFAIYYSATVSLPPDQCLSLLGLTHKAAIERYRFASEQAIARADLLSTQSVVLLQAATLFINALRGHDGSRVSWSLTTLVFSLAQTMGLHRDGTAFGLKPFETEMRRRLWWHICILDSRASEHHGFGPMLYHSQYDTRIPLNVKDEDLFPDMTEPPPEREEATAMCFCLVRCEAMVAATKMRLMSPDVPTSTDRGLGPVPIPLSERTKLIKELEARLQDRYIRHCNTSSPIQLVASLLSRLIVVHFWLMTYYPLMRKCGNRDQTTSKPPQQQPFGGTSSEPTDHTELVDASSPSNVPPVVTRDQLFASSIEILRLSAQIMDIGAEHRWSWYSKIHVQWHIVAFVLSEICRRPPSAECDQAWAAVSKMYTVWDLQYRSTPGLMWKSVRRLMARTRYVRDLQALQGGKKTPDGVNGHVLSTPTPVVAAPSAMQSDFSNLASIPPGPVWNSTLASGATAQVDSIAQLDFHQGIFVPSEDAFMDMLDLPHDLPIDDIFDLPNQNFGNFSGALWNEQIGLDEGN